MTLFRILILSTAFSCAAARAQMGPPPGGPGMGGPGMPGGPGRPPSPFSTDPQGGLQLGPPGRWWNNRDLARTVGLDSKQLHRMDDIFGANRDALLKCFKNLQHEESQLEKLTRSKELDENQIFQQIDRVTQARGEAEKAYAHMQLQIRKELTPEQASRLNDLLPAPTQ